jgi:hypothetical protein
VTEPVTIPKAPYNPYVPIMRRYDYAHLPTTCPACGQLGTPWGGWFSCEDCRCIALVESGEAFVPVGTMLTDRMMTPTENLAVGQDI